MRDEYDYYSILGVTRDAPEAEIRRAFRTLAKALHPDSNRSAGAIPGYDFSVLTEAYETLKDEARRKAYDQALDQARQIAQRDGANGRPRRAFAAGLSIGILFAIAAIGAKVYIDRVASRSAVTKSQESLSTPLAASQPEEERVGRSTERPAGPVQTADLDEGTGSQSNPPEPQTTESQPSKKRSPQGAAPGALSSNQATNPLPGNPKASQAASPPSSKPMPSFAQSVVRLERTIASGNNSDAAYRLVSLVNSATNVDDLASAMKFATKAETRDLIAGRISELKQSPAPPENRRRESRAQIQAGTAAFGLSASSAESSDVGVESKVRPKEAASKSASSNGHAESFSDCAGCPELIVVPAGQAIMGSRPLSEGYRMEEGPAHKVSIPSGFALSKFAVSAGNWRACVEAGACRPVRWLPFSAGQHIPVTRVSWFDARTYVEWLSEATGHQYRLLSEAEWEYAARKGYLGQPSLPANANAGSLLIRDAGSLAPRARIREVSEGQLNPWTIRRFGGGVMEWVEDCWHPNYEHAPSDGSPWLSGNGGDCAFRVVRAAGAAGDEFGRRRASARAREYADYRSPMLGFRVARDISAPSKAAATGPISP